MLVQLAISVVLAVLISMLATGIEEALRRRFGWSVRDAIGAFLSRRNAMGEPLSAGAPSASAAPAGV